MRKGWKRVHRLVVLPDFQGVGIGVKFINAVCDIVASEGFNVNLSTTTPALVGALKRSSKWGLFRKGVVKLSGAYDPKYKGKSSSNYKMKHLEKSSSQRRPTFSFNFKKSIKSNGAT